MTLEQMRAVADAKPFRPFLVHLADGEKIPVNAREFLFTTPAGRTIVIVQPDDTMSIIDLLLVTRLERKPPAAGGDSNGDHRSKRRKR